MNGATVGETSLMSRIAAVDTSPRQRPLALIGRQIGVEIHGRKLTRAIVWKEIFRLVLILTLLLPVFLLSLFAIVTHEGWHTAPSAPPHFLGLQRPDAWDIESTRDR